MDRQIICIDIGHGTQSAGVERADEGTTNVLGARCAVCVVDAAVKLVCICYLRVHIPH